MPASRSRTTWYFVRRLIAYQPFWWTVNAFCWLCFHVWPLASGLLAQAFFNLVSGRAPAGLNLTAVVALATSLGLSRAGIVWLASVSGGQQRFRMRALLWNNLLLAILRRPGARALPGTVGEAISTLRDDVLASNEANDWLFDAFAATLFAVGAAVIMMRVSARVTVLVTAPIALVIATAHAVRARMVQAREESRAATAKVTGALGELFGSVQAIQVAGAEERMLAHLDRLSSERRQAMLRDASQQLWTNAVFRQTADLGTGLLLLVAAAEMRAGSFTIGDFALFTTYLMRIGDFTGFLGYLINTYQQSFVSFRRMVAMLQGEPAEQLVAHRHLPLDAQPRSAAQRVAAVSQSAATKPADRLDRLAVDGLTAVYPESGRGIRDVSFTLERGTLTAVVGRIGAGKTTLARVLLGLIPAAAGTIRWNGIVVDDPAAFMVPPRAAYTAQAPVLLSGTIEENVRLGRSLSSAELARALTSAVMERDLAAFPEGAATVIGARGMRLSGGQIQRLAAARMFAAEAELLVCDDIASALDADTESTFWQRAGELDVTWLVISHRPAVLARADQILVMGEGRIVARGKLEELLQTSPIVQSLWLGDVPAAG